MTKQLSIGKKIKKKQLLSIVIITYNNGEEISKCLDSLKQQVFPKNISLSKLVIIDNNSSDETAETIKRYQKKWNKSELMFKVNPTNFGFAKAINQGIKFLPKKSWFLLLNPDIQFVTNYEIFHLIKCLEKKEAQVAGGLLYKNTGEIQNSFFRIPNFLTAIFEFVNIKKIWPNNPFYKKFYYLNEKEYPPQTSKFVHGVSGSFMLVKPLTFDKIGLLDENFFLYLEDIDFCSRVKKAGLKIIFCPKAKAFHFGGASSKLKRGKISYKAWVNSRRYFFKKHLSLIENIALQPLFLADEIIVLLFSKFRRIFRRQL